MKPLSEIAFSRDVRLSALLLVALMVIGLVANYFPFFILNAHFIFGGFFAMIALQLFGWGRGVLAAAVISASTCFIWNHPWAFVVMTVEGIVVGWLFTRRNISLVIADLLYWLCIGIPIGYFSFRIAADLPVQVALFLPTKQAINGVANSLLARLVFMLFIRMSKDGLPHLREIVFNLSACFVLVSSILLIALDARKDLADTDRSIRDILVQESRKLSMSLNAWLRDREVAVLHLAHLATLLPPSEMQARLEQADASDEWFLRIAQIDREGIAVAYSPVVDELGRSNIGKSFADRPYLPLLKQSLKPMLSEVMPSRFGKTGFVAILLAPVMVDGVYAGAIGGILNFERIRDILNMPTSGRHLKFTLVDRNDNVILTNRDDQTTMKPFFIGKGSFDLPGLLHRRSLPSGISRNPIHQEPGMTIRHWIPDLTSSSSTIYLWGKSRYVSETAIGGLSEWKLILEQPIAPFQDELYREYIQKFFLLFFIHIVSLFAAAWLSRRLTTPIAALGVTTQHLPVRLESEEKIIWPESRVFEIHRLIANVQEMAGALKEKFDMVRRVNDSLNQILEERTERLQEAAEQIQEGRQTTIDLLEDLKREHQARKEREAELQRVTKAIEQAGEMILITDADGTIQYVNPAFTRVTGYTWDEVVGKNPRILKSGIQDDAFYRQMWETLSSGHVWTGRMVNHRKDGKAFTEVATISPVVDETGRIIHYVAVKRDITEELKLMSQLEQAQKMEAVGRLAGGVAHDYNNMLNVILGYTEMALTQMDRSSRVYEYLTEVHRAARRSADITRQLLAFARKQMISPVVLDLNATVESMLKMLRRLIGENIDLEWIPGKGLCSVKIDPSQVDQLLANLCVNARDAIRNVGKITIETRNVVFDEDYCSHHSGFKPGAYVMLAVSDNGCGMEKDVMKHIFEPFFTTKEMGQGTGLGLATVFGIVKQNNGFINAYSEPGKGSTFRIYFPQHVSEGAACPLPEKPKPPLSRGETILVVEDEPSLMKMVSSMLGYLGYTVLGASTPKDALRLAEEKGREIDLLLTDVIMPQMNGKELANELISLNPNLKCLFMSGYTANAIVHHGILDEGVHFIQKPILMNDLAVKVREALDAASSTTDEDIVYAR